MLIISNTVLPQIMVRVLFLSSKFATQPLNETGDYMRLAIIA